MVDSIINHLWSTPKKIAFRFIFIFFLLFIMMSNNGAYPFWDTLFSYPTELLHLVIPWIGKHILSLSYDITVFTNGSGDTTYDYVIVFTAFISAILGTIIWSILDRKKDNYNVLYYWLTVAIRFYVGLMLIQYGLVKVIKLQFPSPSIYRLTQNYGDSSPMGLAWTFLGFSKGYNLFMGVAEMAALLLLFRRTMTFGAIVTLMTTANVMAVNYFYDVPVKIISTALVAMTLFLLLKDIKRLLKFFFTGEAIALPKIKAPEINKKWLKGIKLTLKSLIIAYALIYGIITVMDTRNKYGEGAPKPKLYGLYTVDFHIINNDTLAPLITDAKRWKQFSIEREGYARLSYMNDKTETFTTTIDTVLHTINLTARNNASMKYSLTYESTSTNRFNFKGTIKNDSICILMKKKDLKDYTLTNRGFNWISEYPFNR